MWLMLLTDSKHRPFRFGNILLGKARFYFGSASSCQESGEKLFWRVKAKVKKQSHKNCNQISSMLVSFRQDMALWPMINLCGSLILGSNIRIHQLFVGFSPQFLFFVYHVWVWWIRTSKPYWTVGACWMRLASLYQRNSWWRRLLESWHSRKGLYGIYIYIYMYIHVYTHIHACIHAYIHVYGMYLLQIPSNQPKLMDMFCCLFPDMEKARINPIFSVSRKLHEPSFKGAIRQLMCMVMAWSWEKDCQNLPEMDSFFQPFKAGGSWHWI